MKSMVADLERNEELLARQQTALLQRKVAADSLAYFFNQPDVKEKLVGQGYEVVGTTPEQFATFIETEIAKFTRIVKIAGIPQLSAGE